MLFLNNNDIPFIVVIIASLIAMGFQLAFIFTKQTRKAKKPVRFVTSLSLLYVIIFYTMVIMSDTPFIGHGLVAAVGFIFVIIPLIADTIVDWRCIK
jgi:hypothetical protein